MMVRIGKYEFKGPYESPDNLEDLPGVFAVISVWEGRAELVDIGAAEQVRGCVTTHDRRPFWQRIGAGSRLVYAASYTPTLDEAGRRRIEQELRTQYRVPCGTV